jgi:hypothetical protein
MLERMIVEGLRNLIKYNLYYNLFYFNLLFRKGRVHGISSEWDYVKGDWK